jgi:hypothetical protein
MTYREDFTLPAELLEQAQEQGLDVLPELIRVIICFDEKSLQLLAHITNGLMLKPGRASRQDYEYKRNGCIDPCTVSLSPRWHLALCSASLAEGFVSLLEDFVAHSVRGDG